MPGRQPIRGWQHSVVSLRERHLESGSHTGDKLGETKPGLETCDTVPEGGRVGVSSWDTSGWSVITLLFQRQREAPWPHKHPLGPATLGHMTKRVTFALCCGVHPPPLFCFCLIPGVGFNTLVLQWWRPEHQLCATARHTTRLPPCCVLCLRVSQVHVFVLREELWRGACANTVETQHPTFKAVAGTEVIAHWLHHVGLFKLAAWLRK